MVKELDKLHTERLFLRGINESDAFEIVAWRSDPEVYKYFKSPHKITLKEHFNWYNNCYLNDKRRSDWMCIEKGTGKKIGVFGIAVENDVAEMNYLLAPDAQHKGYAGEAISCLIAHTIDVVKIHHLIAEIHKDNAPSIRLIEKQGFCLEQCKGDFVIYGRWGDRA